MVKSKLSSNILHKRTLCIIETESGYNYFALSRLEMLTTYQLDNIRWLNAQRIVSSFNEIQETS